MIHYPEPADIGMLTTLKRAVRRTHRQPRPPIPIYLFCYHKVGTKLLGNVFGRICADFGWEFTSVAGKCTSVPTECDVVLFNHSLVDVSSINHPFVGVHIIRDPRDIIISGYLYHMRCGEEWCINTSFDITPPIQFPVVPRSQEHKAEKWKRSYVASLGDLSYQENLKRMSQEDGILFEMRRYGSWTVEDMLRWDYSCSNVYETRFENIMRDFEGSFSSIFDHLGLAKDQNDLAREIASVDDINKMTAKQISGHRHISARDTSKWRQYFTDEVKNVFKNHFGDALQRLGYECSSDW